MTSLIRRFLDVSVLIGWIRVLVVKSYFITENKITVRVGMDRV